MGHQQYGDEDGGEIFGLDGDENQAPFVHPVQDAKKGQPAQVPGQLQSAVAAGLQENRQPQDEEDLSVDGEDDNVVEIENLFPKHSRCPFGEISTGSNASILERGGGKQRGRPVCGVPFVYPFYATGQRAAI
jgi:hypothetical protein